MRKIETRINDIVEDLDLFDDELEKYEYIVDIGKQLRPMDESEKDEMHLVQGCTSLVWLTCKKEDGKLVFEADSNTVIVKGLVAILVKIFSNLTAKEINDFDFSLLDKLGLSEMVTPNRQNGLISMIERIKEYAKKESL